VRRAIGIEIGDLLLPSADGAVADADNLIIRCAGNFASVEASGPSGDAPTERILRLDDFPGDAAPRALALVGVELLAARSAAVRVRITRRQTPMAAFVVETVAPAPPPRATSTAREARIGVAGVWRTFVAQAGASAFGGRVEASSTVKRAGFVGGDLEVATARQEIDNVGETTAWMVSTGASFGLCADRLPWRGALALGGRIGLVRESGSSADPARISAATFVRPWGGPMASASVSGTTGRFALMVAGEAGWSLFSVDEVAAGGTAIALRGLWVALSVGVDLRL
jgi:hypothetical protein